MIIKDWERWQTFRKDRGTPSWIKVHRNLFTNTEWVSLTDAEKGQLVSIWLLGADKNGTIPDDPAVIQRMAMLSSKPNINKFIKLGFLVTTCQPTDNQLPTMFAKTVAQSREEESREEERENARTRASRLSKDWQPNEQDRAYCKDKRPDLKPEVVAENFKDYWISKPGSAGTKLDWSATWRTWVRNEKQQKVSNVAPLSDINSPTHDRIDFKKLREAEMMLDTVDPYAALRMKP